MKNLYENVCKQMGATRDTIIEYLIAEVESFDNEFETLNGGTIFIDPDTKELRYNEDGHDISVESLDCFEVVRIYGEFEDTITDMEENGVFDEDEDD